MKYSYVCQSCKTGQTLKRHVDQRNDPAPCACGGTAQRVFDATFQVISDRLCDRPENKYALGFDEKTRLATMKADDKAYEASWHGKVPSKVTMPKESLVETHQKLWGNQ